MPSLVRRLFALLSLLSLPVALIVLSGGAASARVATTTTTVKATSTVTSSSLGTSSPTFTGPAASGCATAGCSLLTGPFPSPSTANLPTSPPGATAAAKNAATPKQLAAAATDGPHAMPSPVFKRDGADPTPPTVSCQPLGPGCDPISTSAGGAKGVKGLNAVDSGTLSTNILVPPDIEPADQGLCASNRYVVETNNIGEILVFNTALQRKSAPIPLDTLMGLTAKGYSSGGDVSCVFDPNNGGARFFPEISSEHLES